MEKIYSFSFLPKRIVYEALPNAKEQSSGAPEQKEKAASEKLEELKKATANLDKDSGETSKKIDSINKLLNEKGEELDQAKIDKNNTKIETLEKEMGALNDEMISYENKLRASEDQINLNKKLAEEYAANLKKEKIAVAHGSVEKRDNLTEELKLTEPLTEEQKALIDKIKSSQEQITAKEKEKEEHTKNAEAAKNKLETAKKAKEANEKALKTVQEALEKNKKEWEELKARESNNVSNKLTKPFIDKVFKPAKEKLAGENEKLVGDIADLKRKIDAGNKEIASLEADMKKHETALKAVETEIEKSKTEIEEAQKELVVLEGQKPKKEELAKKEPEKKEEKPIKKVEEEPKEPEKVKEAAEKEKQAILEEYDKRIELLKKRLEEYREQYKEQPEKFAELEKRTNSVIELYEKAKSEAEPKWPIDHKAGPRLSALEAVNEHFHLAISEIFGKEEGKKALEKNKKEAAEERERLTQEKLKEKFSGFDGFDITFEVGHTLYGDVMAKLGPDKELRKTDKAEYEKLTKETNAKTDELVRALYKAGVNPNMFNKGDRLRVKNNVLYIDRVRGESKNHAVKLVADAAIEDLDGNKYVDLTPKKIEKEIAKAHVRVETKEDALKRGTLFDVLSKWGVKHNFETRMKIWTDMGKGVTKEPYKGSLAQNEEMKKWLRDKKAEGLNALAEKYPAAEKPEEKKVPEEKKEEVPPEKKKEAPTREGRV